MSNVFNFFSILLFALNTITLAGTYVCDTTFKNNDQFMTCSTFNAAKKLIAIDRSKNGVLHGKQEEWYEDGMLRSVTNFTNGNIGDTSLAFYNTGKLQTRAVRNGLSLNLSESGDTLTLTPMRNGKPVGISRAFFQNGNKKAIVHHNDSGQKHGLSEEWREDGTRKDSIVYDNGDIIEYREYYENGKLRRHVYQKPVNRDINAVYYDPKGKKVGEVKNGKGTYISYSEDGKSARRVYMENDEVIKIEEIETE